MAWHLAVSENPIILSGEQILIKGKLDSSAIFAAKAVFPLWGGPGAKDKQGINEGENSSDNAQHGCWGMFRIPPRGICSVKWALFLLAEGTPGATQSSTWRQLMELLEHMQNDLPWHKRGHYTLCRSSHYTKMCEFVFWINFLSFSAGTLANKSAAGTPGKHWQRQFVIGLNSHQDNSETKVTPESVHPTWISLEGQKELLGTNIELVRVNSKATDHKQRW